MLKRLQGLCLLLLLVIGCKNSDQKADTNTTASHPDTIAASPDTTSTPAPPATISPKFPTRKLVNLDSIGQLPDSAFVELITLDTSFLLTMKYATTDNFLKEKVYDCDKCLLRKQPALALLKAHQLLKTKGYRLQVFDCYRPLDVQKKMWKILPDDRYVGNPYGSGSVHNKGAAVDLTLADSAGHELDMGTPFDFFGREAHHAYIGLPAEVLARRRLLRQVMQEAGFEPITSEWWHYSYRTRHYPVANFKADCQ